MTTSITWLTDQTTAVSDDVQGDFLELTFTDHELRFDAVLREQHQHSSAISDKAVDADEALVFAKRANPDRISLEGVITDTPIGDVPPSGNESDTPAVGTIRALEVTPNARASVLQFDRPITRVRDVHETLTYLVKNAIEVTVTTGSRTYTSVMVESAEVSRGSGEGGSASIEITLRSIRRARTQTTTPQPREPRRQPPRDRGQQEASTENPDSDLQRIIDSVRRGSFRDDFSNLINNGGSAGGA